MKTTGHTLAVGLALVVVTALAVQLSAQADPAAGSWMLNVAKSKFSPGPAPKSAMLTIAVAGQGIKVTTEGVSATGAKTSASYTANFDGKDAPLTGSATADTVSLRRINANTVERTDKKAGKVVQTITRVLSADGKTLTITAKGTDAQGRAVNNVTIYEKH
jgi:hypothetical protein